MSLLEDIFLQDEADEARELERIIEGDEYDEKPQQRSDSDDNSEKEDEAEEEKKRVDPSTTKTKRAVRNPRFILNPARLTGPRGIQVIPDHYKDFKFKGKGHEKEDINLVLKKLEHWAYRLYPKFQFEDCLKKIETLGKKRPVMVHLHKIRSDQYITEETVVQKDSSDEENAPLEREEDEFDKLLQQQIELARSTPGPGSVKKAAMDTITSLSITAPKATSSPSISEEQKERMMRNRKLAEERRLARLKNNSNITNSEENNTIFDNNTVETNSNNDIIDVDFHVNKNQNRSNIIDSSDDEEGITMVNESIAVDIHTNENIKARHEEKHIEDSRNNDFDSILIDNERDDNIVEKNIKNPSKQLLNEDGEIQNGISEENEFFNTKEQSEVICETPADYMTNDNNMKDVAIEITDKESDLVVKNVNEDKLKDSIQYTESPEANQKDPENNVTNIINEDISGQVESFNDNNESMEVDFSEEF